MKSLYSKIHPYNFNQTEDPMATKAIQLTAITRSSADLYIYLPAFFLSLLIICMTAVSAAAQTPAPKQDQPVALTGGTIHTISGEVIENGTVVFDDGIITAIGASVQIPSGAEEVDVSGKEIWPGLIDSYSRMGIFEIGAVSMTVDISEEGRFNPNVTPEIAFNPESRHIGTARTNGVLTAVTTPGGGIISGQSSAMMLDGWSWEEMVVQSGTGMMINWPSPGDDYEEEILSLDDFLAEAKAYHNRVQAYENGNASRPENDSRLSAMRSVITGEQPVVVAADELRQIQDAITWTEQEELDIVIVGGRDAHFIATQLAVKEIPVIITTVLDAPERDWEGYDDQYSLPSKLHAAGVPFAIAGSSSAPYAFRLANEAGASAAFGLDIHEAVRAVTLSPAEILGFEDRLGSLEEGKHATLLITNGNPLEYSTQIEQAYIQGRKIDMVDAHRAFYEKYRQKVERAVD